MEEEEIADARRDAKPELCQLFREPIPPDGIVFHGALKMSAIGKRRGGGGERRPVHVERPARAVQRLDQSRRPVGPADAKIGEAKDLGEGSRHDDIVSLGSELYSARIIVAADIFRVSRVEHEEHVPRQR
jgi:hypothetical protein